MTMVMYCDLCGKKLQIGKPKGYDSDVTGCPLVVGCNLSARNGRDCINRELSHYMYIPIVEHKGWINLQA